MTSIDWVNKQRAQGKSDEEITVLLVGKGLNRDKAISLIMDARTRQHHETLDKSEFITILTGLFGMVVFIGVLISKNVTLDGIMGLSINPTSSFMILIALVIFPLIITYFFGIRHDMDKAKKMFLLYISFIGSAGTGFLLMLIAWAAIAVIDWPLPTYAVLLITGASIWISAYTFSHLRQHSSYHFFKKERKSAARNITSATVQSALFMIVMLAALFYSEKFIVNKFNSMSIQNAQGIRELEGNHPYSMVSNIPNSILRSYFMDHEKNTNFNVENIAAPTITGVLVDKPFDDLCDGLNDRMITPLVVTSDIRLAQRYFQFKAMNPHSDITGYDKITWPRSTSMTMLVPEIPEDAQHIASINKLSTCLESIESKTGSLQGFAELRDSIERNPGSEANELKAFLVWMRAAG